VRYRQCTLSTFIFIAELQTAKTNHVHRFVIKELGILLRFFHGPLHIILTLFEKNVNKTRHYFQDRQIKPMYLAYHASNYWSHIQYYTQLKYLVKKF